MNRTAALSIRYGIALARDEAAHWYLNYTATGSTKTYWPETEARLIGVVRLRYRRAALDALHRTRAKEMGKMSKKASEYNRKMLG